MAEGGSTGKLPVEGGDLTPKVAGGIPLDFQDSCCRTSRPLAIHVGRSLNDLALLRAGADGRGGKLGLQGGDAPAATS